MTSLAELLCGKPIKIINGLVLYQPALLDVIQMSEGIYWSLIKIWTLSRGEILIEENEYSSQLSDYEVWKRYVFDAPELKSTLESSILIFFRKKIEFLPHNGTIYIGDIQEGLRLDEDMFEVLRNLFARLADTSAEKKQEPYKKDAKMNAKTKAMIARIEAAQKKVDSLKNGDFNSNDALGKQIVALVAIGSYTFEQVYNMTMLQFIYLLKKYVDIENFELHTLISPYMSSKDKGPSVEHWLNT